MLCTPKVKQPFGGAYFYGRNRKNRENPSINHTRVKWDKLQINFIAEKPFEKLTTDVTEFSVCNEKVYLSNVMDLYNREIISYSISKSPNFWQTREIETSQGSKAFTPLGAGLTIPNARVSANAYRA